MVERALLAGNRFLFGFALFGGDGFLDLSVVFDLAGSFVQLAVDFLIDDGAETVDLFGGLDGSRFLQVVEIDRIFHQLVQLF